MLPTFARSFVCLLRVAPGSLYKSARGASRALSNTNAWRLTKERGTACERNPRRVPADEVALDGARRSAPSNRASYGHPRSRRNGRYSRGNHRERR